MRKRIVILLAATTKGGKTTIAMSLCHSDYRRRMVALSNCRTEVTVDWIYDPKVTDIKLKDVFLNYGTVFGVDSKERINCEKFSKVLDSKEGKYLRDIFGLEKQENLNNVELEKYVLDTISSYVNSCDDDKIANIIKDKKSNQFLRRIEVLLPPVEEFVQYFKNKEVSLVLRDTRGFLDIDAKEATSLQLKTMQELGIDGIDAVLLLGSNAPFPDIHSWYKNAYRSAFESVPIFVMVRSELPSVLYKLKYKKDVTVENVQNLLMEAKKCEGGFDELPIAFSYCYELLKMSVLYKLKYKKDVTVENVQNLLMEAKKCEGGFDELPIAFSYCYELLKMFELGKMDGVNFRYNYKVYENEDLRYIYPNSSTLAQSSDNPNYDCDDYRLYETIIFENFRDILDKIIEHSNFVEAIYGQIQLDFIDTLQSNVNVEMYPNFNNYDRNDVCENILSGSILGPRDGIVTVEHGDVKYLGAVTMGVSARAWLKKNVYEYTYAGSLKKPDGTDMISKMSKDCQDNLVRMTLFNIIEKKTDYNAYFRGYYFMNRYLIKEAILNVRNKKMSGDALNNASKEIAKIVFSN